MSLQTPAKGVQGWRWCDLQWQTIPDLGTNDCGWTVAGWLTGGAESSEFSTEITKYIIPGHGIATVMCLLSCEHRRGTIRGEHVHTADCGHATMLTLNSAGYKAAAILTLQL